MCCGRNSARLLCMVTIIKITKGNKNKFLQRKYTSFISKRQHLHNYVKLERLNGQKIQIKELHDIRIGLVSFFQFKNWAKTVSSLPQLTKTVFNLPSRPLEHQILGR